MLRKLVAISATLGLLFVFGLILSTENGETLVVYSTHDSGAAEKIFREFEEQTGFKIETRFAPAGLDSAGLVEQIIREKDAPRADVFWSDDLLGMLDLQKHGLLKPYRGPGFARIPAAFRAEDGSWAGFAARLRVVLANTEKIGRTPPNLDGMLPGSDRSKIAFANPLSGTTLAHYAVLWKLWGSERVKTWHREWRTGGVREFPDNAAVKNAVADGVCFAGYTDSDDYFAARDAGKPVAMSPVRLENEQTIVLPDTVAILRGTKRGEAAQKLVDFLLSEATELALARSAARRIPLGPIAVDHLPKDVRELTTWTRNGADLTLLSPAREEFLAWVKTEFPP